MEYYTTTSAYQTTTDYNNFKNANDVPVAEVMEVNHDQYMYNQPTSFVIKYEWFGGGNATITDKTTKAEVFKMVRMGGSVMLKNNLLTINNMDNQPLFALQEHQYGAGSALELVSYDPINPNIPAAPMCRLVRKFGKLTLHNRYIVELLSPSMKAKYGGSIKTKGKWPYRFTFSDSNGKELATVVKSKMKTWELTVSPGEDVSMFLGISCAINRLIHEAGQRKATAAWISAC